MGGNKSVKFIVIIFFLIIIFFLAIIFRIYYLYKIEPDIIKQEIDEIEHKVSQTVFKKPAYYSKKAVEKYIKSKYGKDCKLIKLKKRYEQGDYEYKFERTSRNDYFYVYTSTSAGVKGVNGGVIPDYSKFTRNILEDYVRYNIACCHLEEIKKLAIDNSLKYNIETDDRTKQLYLKITIDNIEEVERFANYMVSLDDILQFSDDPYSVEVNFIDKKNWIRLASGENERLNHTKEFYINEFFKNVKIDYKE